MLYADTTIQRIFMIKCAVEYECIRNFIYRLSQVECARLQEGVPYGKVYQYNPKHPCQKLNGYGDNGQRKVWPSCGSMHYSYQLTKVISVSLSVLSFRLTLTVPVISPDTNSCECADRNVTSESASL
jgi:hypothetical protein